MTEKLNILFNKKYNFCKECRISTIHQNRISIFGELTKNMKGKKCKSINRPNNIMYIICNNEKRENKLNFCFFFPKQCFILTCYQKFIDKSDCNKCRMVEKTGNKISSGEKRVSYIFHRFLS